MATGIYISVICCALAVLQVTAHSGGAGSEACVRSSMVPTGHGGQAQRTDTTLPPYGIQVTGNQYRAGTPMTGKI